MNENGRTDSTLDRRGFFKTVGGGLTAAALLFAIDTPVIHYANKVLSETLFAVVFFATFLAVLRVRGIRGAVLAGLATGALVLIRPVAILWFVVVAIYFFVSERRRLIAAFAVSALLLPIAWGTRNLMRTGVFTIFQPRFATGDIGSKARVLVQ